MPAQKTAPTVLVVDDEPSITDLICAELADAGLSVRGCTHAAEAFWFMQRAQPQVVILDVQMPGLDGIDLLQQLRADPQTAGLPVIFLTAHAENLRRRLPNFAALGAQLLPKPFEVERLLQLVRQAVAARMERT